MEISVGQWIEINRCDPDPEATDLGSGITRKEYRGCAADVVFYHIAGMDHAWPLHECKGPGAAECVAYEELDYLEEVLAFFDEHPMR